MTDLMAKVESKYMKEKIPDIDPGDTVRVRVQTTEGEGKEQSMRTHSFEGTVIACKGGGINRSITVRRVTYGIGVERTFPLHSPIVVDVEVVRRAHTRRAKLYYLRKRHERAARLKERREKPKAAVAAGGAQAEPEVAEPVEEPVPEAAAEPAEEAAAEAEAEVAEEPEVQEGEEDLEVAGEPAEAAAPAAEEDTEP